MQITARYYGFFSTVTRKLYEPLDVDDGLSVKDLIGILESSYGYRFMRLCFIRPLYSDREYANVCLNHLDLNVTHKFPRGIDTVLREGDIVSFGVMGGAA
jgi:molybdopterin converting factor small subunit